MYSIMVLFAFVLRACVRAQQITPPMCVRVCASSSPPTFSSVCPNNNNINNNSGAAADAEQNHVTVVEPPKLGPDDTAVHTMARAR